MNRKAAMLSEAQRKALEELGNKPGHFRVNWQPNLSVPELFDLRQRKLIEEHWTWASVSRPDTGITEAGRSALQESQASEAEG